MSGNGEMKQGESAGSVLVNFASGIIGMQLTLAERDFDSLENDKYSLGYVFGFHDASSQAFGLHSDTEGFAALSISYASIGGVDAVQLLRKSLDLQGDDIFKQGVGRSRYAEKSLVVPTRINLHEHSDGEVGVILQPIVRKCQHDEAIHRRL